MNTENKLFDRVKNYILLQSKAGEKIKTETELAKQFGVTRYKIRKTLTTLSQMGILDRTPKKGSVIRRLETSSLSDQIQFHFKIAGFDVAEFVEARILIECAIMPLAVRRITPSIMTQLEEALLQMEAHADNPLEADQHDRDFHLLILRACGNRVLQVFSGVLVTYFEKTSATLASFNREHVLEIVEKQREILQAMKAGNGELATQMLHAHLTEKSITN